MWVGERISGWEKTRESWWVGEDARELTPSLFLSLG